MPGATSGASTCAGCGLPYDSPALGTAGEAVCPACGAPLGEGPRPDDTAAFQRFYTAPSRAEEPGTWWRRLLARLQRRS